MKATLPLVVIFSLVTVGSLRSFGDDILRNGNLQSGLSGWHGDGHLVSLDANGAEVDDSGPATTPAIKLRLSHDPQEVYQEYETHDTPTSLNISVEAMASGDFHRSDDKSVYTTTWSSGGTWYWSALAVPTADFWIRGGGSNTYYYKLSDLKAAIWTTIKGHFENLAPSEQHTVSFCVPPGTGAVYIRNAVVAP